MTDLVIVVICVTFVVGAGLGEFVGAQRAKVTVYRCPDCDTIIAATSKRLLWDNIENHTLAHTVALHDYSTHREA